MAKRFKFRLETLLTLRKRHEDRQRRVVAERVGEVGRSREVLADLHCGVANTLSEARCDRERASIDVSTARLEQQWRAHLKNRIAEQEAEIKGLESQLDVERCELARRATERKAIEKLRERRLEEHTTAATRLERFAEDEMASTMCLRRARDTGRMTVFGG